MLQAQPTGSAAARRCAWAWRSTPCPARRATSCPHPTLLPSASALDSLSANFADIAQRRIANLKATPTELQRNLLGAKVSAWHQVARELVRSPQLSEPPAMVRV